ncbi:hypothetical protein ONZ45_g19549 [Pleurotus djamor]|nr:hypothetical protein ONZ45_g19549 [Pleurotus djamor]
MVVDPFQSRGKHTYAPLTVQRRLKRFAQTSTHLPLIVPLLPFFFQACYTTMTIPYRQDMPPAGGFESVKYKRNLPVRGPGALAILGGVTAVELHREKVWSRIHLVPLLMAEGDRDAYRRREAAVAREKEIMKDVPGWVAGSSVYTNAKYQSPEIVIL